MWYQAGPILVLDRSIESFSSIKLRQTEIIHFNQLFPKVLKIHTYMPPFHLQFELFHLYIFIHLILKSSSKGKKISKLCSRCFFSPVVLQDPLLQKKRCNKNIRLPQEQKCVVLRPLSITFSLI